MEFDVIDMPSRYLGSVANAAAEHDIDLGGFLQTHGLNRESLQLPEATIKASTYLKAIAYFHQRYQSDKPFTLEIVRQTALTNHGLLSLAGMCAPNYRAALTLMQDYSSLILPAVSFSLHEEKKACFVRIHPNTRIPDIPEIFMEIMLGFFYPGKILTGIPPKKITLAHTPEASTSYYEAFWGCPVQINQPHYELHMEWDLLDKALPTADPENFARMEKQLKEQLDTLINVPKLRLQIETLLANSQNGHFMNLEEMADALCMSPRTLRRRLEKENCSYKQLVNDVRQRMAEQQLKNPDLPVGQIARHLGFATEASFSRAFKTWTGLSPQQFRGKS